MSRWVDTPAGHRCTVHGAEFDRGEVCVACTVDPGPAIGAEERDEEPLERELRLIEAECNQRAKRMWRAAEELLSNGDVGDACKASAEATKWTRLALEINERRTQKQELAELIKKYRALLGKDGSN